MQGTHGHLSTEQVQKAFRLRKEGWRLIDIAKEIGCTAPMVGLMVRAGHGPGRAAPPVRVGSDVISLYANGLTTGDIAGHSEVGIAHARG